MILNEKGQLQFDDNCKKYIPELPYYSTAIRNLVTHTSGIPEYFDEAVIQFPHLPRTIAAIDIALHDAFCEFTGIPVVNFYGRKIEGLATLVAIGKKDTAAMLEEATINYQAAFKVIKIKTGLDVDQDIERVAKLTKQFGNKMRTREDANQGYDLAQLKYFMEETKQLAMELIEQRLKVDKENELTSPHKTERKKLAADKSQQ